MQAPGQSTAPAAANPQAVADATAGASEPQLTFSLSVAKTAGKSLGIDVTYSSAQAWTRNGVFIAKVFEDGIVAAWNAQSQEPQRVRPNDFIFQVNEIHGDTLSMIQEMKGKQHLTIHILRRSTGPTRSVSSTAPVAAVAAAAAASSQLQLAEELQRATSAEGEVADMMRTPPTTAEALLPELIALGDEALAGLVCVALERRPWLRAVVLAPQSDDEGDAGDTEDLSVNS